MIMRGPLRLATALVLLLAALVAPAVVNAQASDIVKVEGSITGVNGTVEVPVSGRAAVAIHASGTWVATLTPEVSVDGTNWEVTQFYDPSGSARAATTTTTGTYWILGTAGMNSARVKATAYTSGTVTVTLRAGGSALSLPADVTTSAPGSTAAGMVVRSIAGSGTSATEVQGTAASGSAAVGNPVQIGGIQTSGSMQSLKVGPDGYVWAVLGASSSAIGKLSPNSGVDIGDVSVDSIAAGDNNIGNFDLASAIPTGANTIGAVTQASGPWTVIGAATGSVGSANGLGILGRTAAGAFNWFSMAADGTLRIDPTGTTTQPVSGTVTANAGTGTFTTGGVAADGAAVSGNPVRVAGKDGSGNTQDILTDTGGAVQVDIEAGSTVTTTQGASTSLPWPVTITSGDGTRTTWDARTPAVAQVNVTTSATQLTAAPPAKQVQACFMPMGAEVRFGPSGVTWATGWPVAASQSMCIDLYNSAAYYAIVNSGTVDVRTLTTVSAN